MGVDFQELFLRCMFTSSIYGLEIKEGFIIRLEKNGSTNL